MVSGRDRSAFASTRAEIMAPFLSVAAADRAEPVGETTLGSAYTYKQSVAKNLQTLASSRATIGLTVFEERMQQCRAESPE